MTVKSTPPPPNVVPQYVDAAIADTYYDANIYLRPGIYEIRALSSTTMLPSTAAVVFYFYRDSTQLSTLTLTSGLGVLSVAAGSEVTRVFYKSPSASVRVAFEWRYDTSITSTLAGEIFTSSTTYPSTGTGYVVAVGGGGGGGGGKIITAGNVSGGGGGGGSGGVVAQTANTISLTAGTTITIGAAGNGGAVGAAGNAGGTTNFGNTISATGGGGGASGNVRTGGTAGSPGGGAGGAGGYSPAGNANNDGGTGGTSTPTISALMNTPGNGTTGGGGGGGSCYSATGGGGAGGGGNANVGRGGDGGAASPAWPAYTNEGSTGTGRGSGGGGGAAQTFNGEQKAGAGGSAGVVYVFKVD